MHCPFRAPQRIAITKTFLSFVLAGLLAATLRAELRLPGLLSDGMVVQRDASWTAWGWAEPGEAIELGFAGRAAATTAEADGRWEVELPALPAGGPYVLTVRGAEETLTVDNILLGDVWVASGQSNMELPVRRVQDTYPEAIATSANARIRHFGVPTAYDFDAPHEDVPGGQWLEANPDNVMGFSAVAYFFAREIEARTGVPIGVINSSVGGSPVESWMSEAALQQFPASLEEAHRFRDDALIAQIEAENEAINAAWYGRREREDLGLQADPPWSAANFQPAEEWPTMDIPGFWDEGSELEPLHGVVWFRREIEIPEELAGEPALLHLGAIVDADTTYVNGVQVGDTTYMYPPRRYEVPAGLLVAGANVITIRASATGNRGAFVPDKPYELLIGDTAIDLTGEWSYQVGMTTEPIEPTTFIRWKPLGLYNAMMAPLQAFPIKGVLWYQGESNADTPSDYAVRLETLIEDWRATWGQPDLPFYFVQLANYMEPTTGPVESGWAELQDQQRRTLAVPHTGMAVANDLGEWNDIHPVRKAEVAHRLALLARRHLYGEEDLVASGPLYAWMSVQQGRAILRFEAIGGGLVAHRSGFLGGFTVAGEDGVFHPARAEIVEDTVVVTSTAVPQPVRVRYAWSHNPIEANLYNVAGLPASPFDTGSALGQ
ncbi:MAG: sialate O-acetylesterase [Opitutales bacterium]